LVVGFHIRSSVSTPSFAVRVDISLASIFGELPVGFSLGWGKKGSENLASKVIHNVEARL
jgi:hypothetical protein